MTNALENTVLAVRDHPRLHIPDRSLRRLFRPDTAFQTCGLTGLAIGLPFSMAVATHAGLSPVLMAVIGLASFVALLGTGMAAKILTGQESLIYYRDVIAIFAVAAAIPWLLHRPVLRYLDVTILGAGIFLACGRIGCFLVGCCHGRPCRWGVRYGEEHPQAGFPSWLVGVRLFPIQLVEAVWVLGFVAVGTVWQWRGCSAGDIFSLYVVAYGAGRFCIEFFRGDDDRPYLAGFSEAQWTSFVLMSGAAILEQLGALPAHAWHGLVLATVVLAIAVLTFVQGLRRSEAQLSFHPKHLKEIAQAIRSRAVATAAPVPGSPPDENGKPICLARTSQGLQISGNVIRRSCHMITHFSISRPANHLTPPDAAKLARLFAHFLDSSGHCRILPGNRGVIHLVFSMEQVASGRQGGFPQGIRK
jgi:hypothetical protein